MNILKEYTWDYIKRNKRSSLGIMIAILMASILINMAGLYSYNAWKHRIHSVISQEGNWHGELFDETLGANLDYVKAYASVEEVMVKGQWYVSKIDDERRPYLIMRDADEAYWDSMGEKNGIIDGTVPSKRNEIVVSKQFTERYPEYKVGDYITLPVGERLSEGKNLDPVSHYIEGEIFKFQKEVTYRVVGILDIETPSTFPGFTGIGYLEHEDILPEDKLTIYIRFKNICDTYKELPKIAEGIGYQKDEYGNYLLRYNSGLLANYLVFPKTNRVMHIGDFERPISILVLAVVLVSLFVFIIHNAFEVSMYQRKRQLGMFKSIGATPKQIKSSIIFEAMVLSVIPMVLGSLLSDLLMRLFMQQSNKVNQLLKLKVMAYETNLVVMLITNGLVFLTAWLSSYIPSLKVSKKMPIEILKGKQEVSRLSKKKKPVKLKKLDRRNRNTSKMVQNIYLEIAANNFKAHKKTFRTSIISLTLSLFIVMCFLTGIASGNLVNDIYFKDEAKNSITLSIVDGNPVSEEIEKVLENHKYIKDYMQKSVGAGSIYISKDKESEAFKEIGGLEEAAKRNWALKREEQYRVGVRLVGLDDRSFKAYCSELGIDWKDYYDVNQPKAIIYNQIEDWVHSTNRNTVTIPFLKLSKGESLLVSEKTYDSDIGNYAGEIIIGEITNQSPSLSIRVSKCALIQIMPLSIYQSIISNWEVEKEIRSMRVRVQIEVDEWEHIVGVADEIKAICDRIYGSGDYGIINIVKEKQDYKIKNDFQRFKILFLASIFMIIGMSNAFSTVYTNLSYRSREFAILRSIGISRKGINKLLVMEASRFAIKPILYAAACEIVWMSALIKIDESSWNEFISYIPIGIFILFTILLIIIVVTAYLIGSYQIRRQNIVEAIKDETI